MCAPVVATVAGGSARASDFWDEVRTPGLEAARKAVGAGDVALGHNSAGEALQWADAAMRSCPTCADAYTLRGRSLYALGRHGEALVAFERALVLAKSALSTAASAQAAASSAMVVGRTDVAVAVLSALLASRGDPAERDRTMVMLADAYQLTGPAELPRARSLYRSALPRAELEPAMLLGLALALHRSGEQAAAVAMVQRLQPNEASIASKASWLPPAEQSARYALWLTAVGDVTAADRAWQLAGEGGGPHVGHANQTRAQLAAPRPKP